MPALILTFDHDVFQKNGGFFESHSIRMATERETGAYSPAQFWHRKVGADDTELHRLLWEPVGLIRPGLRPDR